MTIEIHQPELEALILQRMETGRFSSVEDVLLHALRSGPGNEDAPPPHKRSLEEVFAMVRGMADDADFTRNPSTGRPIDLS